MQLPHWQPSAPWNRNAKAWPTGCALAQPVAPPHMPPPADLTCFLHPHSLQAALQTLMHCSTQLQQPNPWNCPPEHPPRIPPWFSPASTLQTDTQLLPDQIQGTGILPFRHKAPMPCLHLFCTQPRKSNPWNCPLAPPPRTHPASAQVKTQQTDHPLCLPGQHSCLGTQPQLHNPWNCRPANRHLTPPPMPLPWNSQTRKQQPPGPIPSCHLNAPTLRCTRPPSTPGTADANGPAAESVRLMHCPHSPHTLSFHRFKTFRFPRSCANSHALPRNATHGRNSAVPASIHTCAWLTRGPCVATPHVSFVHLFTCSTINVKRSQKGSMDFSTDQRDVKT